MKCNNSGVSVSSHWWSAKSYGTDAMSDSSQRAQNLHEAPLTGKLLLFQTTAKNYVSCQSPNPAMWETRGSPFTECTASFKAKHNTARGKFGSGFAEKEGQWDCNICSVRNESTAS